MAYRRRSTRRTQRRYPRKVARRRMARRRLGSLVVRKFAITTTVPIDSMATNLGGAITVQPNSLFTSDPGFPNFNSLFEQFRVMKVEHQFRFDRNSSAVQTAELGGYPFFYYADYNDDTAPTSATNVLNHSGVRRGMCFGGHAYSISYRPRVAATVDGTVNSAVAPWLDTTAGNNLKHYGAKYLIQRDGTTAGTSTHIGHMYIQTVVTIAFRGARAANS